MADDTAAVIEQLGLGRVDIVGHNDGANVALLLARDQPELVGRLVAGVIGGEAPYGPDHWMQLLAKCYQMWIQPVVIEPADLKKITAPVLAMAGDHDFTSIDETAAVYRSLPNGQLIILLATGHETLRHRPELANLAIREFPEQPTRGPKGCTLEIGRLEFRPGGFFHYAM